MTGILNALIAGVSGAVKDAYFNLVSLLLPGNGTNGAQNNTFLDSSTNNFTITRNGNTTQGTFSPFSQTGWGNYFGGSADWLTTSSSVTALGAGNWTVEFWLYPTTSGTTRIISDARTSSQGLYPLFGLSTANAAIFYVNTTTVLSSTNTVSANTWTHVAFVKNSATTTCYINGVASGSFSDSNTYLANPITFGASGFTADSHGSKFTGYISNYRQVVGRAVYTSNFTPPTSPLGQTSGGQNPPTGTQTSLLTCQSNRFVDNSSSPYTITPSGSPSVVAFSPFAPTAAYTTAAVGGSGYFDGTGDYLNLSNNVAFEFGTGDFTIEFWHYSNSSGTQTLLYDSRPATTNGLYPTIYKSSGNVLVFYTNTADRITGTTSLLANTWNHVALSRSGTATKLFLNGIQEGSTYTDSNNYTNGTSRPLIGGDGYSTSSVLNGYLSDVRIVKGTAVYTSAFTPPTAPLTTITNTSLLLNFTNAGITDATAKNDLETVGNAQISTAIPAKWGSGSMSFNGTTDYALGPRNVLIDLGAADFTIELWAYITSTTAKSIINLTNRTAYPGLLLKGNDTSLQLLVASGDASWAVNLNVTGLSSVLNTWAYIAVVRSGNVFTLYRNGTSVGTTTVSMTVESNLQPVIGVAIDSVGPSDYFSGYMQDVRITKGYARTITASPTAPFPRQ